MLKIKNDKYPVFMSIKISKKKPPIIYILILYENNIHLKIEKDIYQVFVLIKDLIKIHVPNYILLFVPDLWVCVLHQHSRICVKIKVIDVRKQCG